MPRLHAKHRTEIRYAGPVGESVNEIRLLPSGNGRQAVEWATVRTEPPAELLPHVDAYGNEVRWFQLTEPHDVLLVESEAVVVTRPAPPRAFDSASGFDDTTGDDYGQLYAEFLSGSPFIRWVEPVASFADALELDESFGVLAWARALEAGVNRAITYTQGATRVDTPIEEVVRAGRGVCQDMAHVMIACARRRGIAARYISGWLNLPNHSGPGESHAWAELAIPGLGWVEFDPTHPEPSSEHYVRLAVGRDYADVPPLRGSYLGPPTEGMTVTVEVRELPG
ncbi:transglutaminase family protein [Miltoncostaea oceani]|jgi:transglutaminase-like putative cysteine protease|uniref:transglutaminase family protein n=1 Tax=Miltoncostaea oceani TaxID=2843216 RepID=UPI001C3D908D|nr:transglutaminase family protein [Miltoncostaea oceani]